ncbi:MAG: hypothetical protein PHU23_00205 [Dehalococcoidales bacterium]|nr:hypothetical protein [Dehalococcoidales bacterium]
MASVSVDLGSIRSIPYSLFHAFGMEWVFYSQYYKTSYDAGVSFELRQTVPINVGSLYYDKVNNRVHVVYASGNGGSNNPVYYVNGVPAEDGTITWGQVQSMWPGTGIGTDKNNAQITCDSNGCPWITFGEVNLMGTSFAHVVKSSTKDIFTEQWHKTSSIHYPGSEDSPHFRLGLMIPSGSIMYYAYSITRTDSYYHNIDPDPPVLFYRTINQSGSFSDPPTRIKGIVNSQPTGGVKVGNDLHIVWPDSETNSILHSVGTTVKVVQSGLTRRPNIMYDIRRNRLLCFWNQSNHIYYKAYDLATGIWEATPVDWLNESAYGGISSDYLQMDPLNDFEYERTPVAYNSMSYVRFALSNLQPPVVRTLPAT